MRMRARTTLGALKTSLAFLNAEAELMSDNRGQNLANFDQFGEYELTFIELSHCMIEEVSAGGATAAAVDAGCPNVLCNPENLVCGGINACISNIGCVPNIGC